MSGFRGFRRYFTLPFRTAATIRRDVDDELDTHIAMRAEALERSGIPRDDARRLAREQFGDVDDAKAYCAAADTRADGRRRLAGWFGELRQDAAYGVRGLRRSPAYALATVVTLALGIGATTAVYGVLDAYLFRPLPVAAAERLFLPRIVTAGERQRSPRLDAIDWTRMDTLFDAAARWDLDGFTLADGDFAERVSGTWVSPAFFRALDLSPALGRGFRPDDYATSAPVAIISHALWQRRFNGDTNVLGRTATMHAVKRTSEPTSVAIIGILPRDFWPIHWRTSELLRPMRPDAHAMPMMVRLRAGATPAASARRLESLVRAQLGQVRDTTWRVELNRPFEAETQRVRPMLRAVFGAALCMLLAACASVAATLMSRMAKRRDELGIRVALGGTRARIARQLLTESAMLSAAAAILGLVLAILLLHVSGPLVQRLLGLTIPGGPERLRSMAVAFQGAVALGVTTSFIIGLVPAIAVHRFDRRSPALTLAGSMRGRASGGGVAMRRVLIATQLAVATTLAFGAGLMFRSIARMAETPLGFRTDGVVRGSFSLSRARYPDSAAKQRGVEGMIERLTATPGVSGAAVVFPYPFGQVFGMPVQTEGMPENDPAAPKAMIFTASPTYFETMGIPLRAGRALRWTDDRAAPQVVVISETLAERLGGARNVIGRRIRVFVPFTPSFDEGGERPWRMIVGVVGDTRKTYAGDAVPDIYVPYAQNPRTNAMLVVRTGTPSPGSAALRRAVAAADPALPLSDVGSLDELVALEGGQSHGLGLLLGAFAAFALGLTALSLYAALSYSVAERRSELAIRMAIGADAGSVLRLVLREGILTAGAGAVAGIGASLALGRVLEHQLYGVGTRDPATLATIVLVLALTSAMACLVPAVRAIRTDPALALRALG